MLDFLRLDTNTTGLVLGIFSSGETGEIIPWSNNSCKLCLKMSFLSGESL